MKKGMKKLATTLLAALLMITQLPAVESKAATSIGMSGKAHVQSYGDTNGRIIYENGIETLVLGTRGQAKRVESITVNLKNNTGYTGTIQYRVHRQTYGWTDWTTSGQPAGTTGQGKRLEAMQIRLTGELANHYDVRYRVHIQTYGDNQGWVYNGALAGTTGEAKRLEEVKIQIVPKNIASETPSINYRVHRQTYGWETTWAKDGAVSGTTGQGKRLEGISIDIKGTSYCGSVEYQTHVQSYGWMNWVADGAMSGTSGQAKRLEAIQIYVVPKGMTPSSGTSAVSYVQYGKAASKSDQPGLINYATHVQTYGNQQFVSDGSFSGTYGEAKRLEAIRIQVNNDALGVDGGVTYHTHVQKLGWQPWVSDGVVSGTTGQAKRLEAIQIIIVQKWESPVYMYNASGESLKGSESCGFVGTAKTNTSDANGVVTYKTHVQSYGNQNWVSDGSIAGTSGEAKRLEAIYIKLNASKLGYTGGIRYKTHVQSFGWEKEWKKDGQMSGTSGKAKRLEAIRIELTGTISSYYDVYYRVHAQSYGWMGWAKNGETAGTAGLGKRLEAIQICLVEKGSDAPNALPAASNAKAYQGTPEPVDNSIIYVYSWNTELGERLEYFKDKYPQYADKVKFENLGLSGTSDEYKKEIEAAYQKGGQKVPSIVAMDEDVSKYFMSSDMFVSMDSIGITKKDYSNAFQYTIDYATVNGKLKGLCWQATPGCFVYRTDIAQKVLGTSDPAKVQTYVKDWDAFMQTAEKMKQAGYKMVSGPKEIQNAALADRKSAWVNDGTVTIDPAVDKYLELAMQLIDNGYTNKNDPWTDGWVSDFTGDVFGYFGCPWFVYWTINDEESGSATAGKRNICAGPSAYNWGGTYLSVTDKCPNKELAALVLKTLCCDTDVMYKIQDETLDFVNNKAVVQKMIANGKGATPILGGANPLQTWYNVAVKVDGSKATQYDSVFEGYLYTDIDGYENGYNESKDNMKSMLKAMIKDGYPNLTVK